MTKNYENHWDNYPKDNGVIAFGGINIKDIPDESNSALIS
jgi:hypothetical protein